MELILQSYNKAAAASVLFTQMYRPECLPSPERIFVFLSTSRNDDFSPSIYSIVYLHLVNIPLLFGPEPSFGLFTYGWTDGNTGLAYLGCGIGSTLGTLRDLNRIYAW